MLLIYLYTKSVAKAYTAHLWQDITTYEYLIDGHSTIPTVSCDVSNFKYTDTSRVKWKLFP